MWVFELLNEAPLLISTSSWQPRDRSESGVRGCSLPKSLFASFRGTDPAVILHGFERYSRHRAVNDSLHIRIDLELRQDVFIWFRHNVSSVMQVGKQGVSCYTRRLFANQVRSNDANINFFHQRHLRCTRVATRQNFQEQIRNITMCIDLMMLGVNVPVIFSGM